jgi:hypothetical protein
MSPILVLEGVGLLAVAGLVILAVVIVGIHRGDRRHLASIPQPGSDAFARRLLLSVRYPADNDEEAGQ